MPYREVTIHCARRICEPTVAQLDELPFTASNHMKNRFSRSDG